jgi:guanylate kinase
MGSNVSDLTGPKPLIIAGPSGVGKGTIIAMLMKKFPDVFGFSVSHTTRDPRAGEVDGVQYHFVNMEQMTRDINEGKFIEHALVHTNYYGTSFSAVQHIQDQGKICILDIDVQGVQNVKVSGLECRKIFIAPPTIDELERRLRGRMSESDERISIRLHNARGEIAFGMEPGNFDSIVVNDALESTYAEIVDLLKGYYPKFSFQEIVEPAAVEDGATEAEGEGKGDGDEKEA